MQDRPGEPSVLDTFELELRKLPGVIAAGFAGNVDDLTVHLHVRHLSEVDVIETEAAELVGRYLDRPVAFVVTSADGPPATATTDGGVDLRPSEDAGTTRAQAERRLREAADARQASSAVGPTTAEGLATESSGHRRVELVGVHAADREVEVHLAYRGRRTVGRASAARPVAAAAATLAALTELGWSLAFTVRSAVHLAVGLEGVVAVALSGPVGERMGVSRAPAPEEAAAKATLQALNRYLDDPRHRP